MSKVKSYSPNIAKNNSIHISNDKQRDSLLKKVIGIEYTIHCKDKKSKKGIMKINDKVLETPLFIPGFSFRGNNGNPRFWLPTNVDDILFNPIMVSALMVNAYDYGVNNGEKTIHEKLDFYNTVFMDSGGYQFLSKKIIPDPEIIIEVQKKSSADIVIPLDRPIPRNPSERQIQESINVSLKYNTKWLEEFPNKTLPVIHGTDVSHLVRQMEELSEPKAVGIGSLVPQFMYSSRKKTVLLVSEFTSLYPDIYIHAFGVSYSLASLLFMLGIDSVDSSSWIHNSRFGSLRIPHGGPRSVANRTKSNSKHKSLSYKEWLELDCNCPVCSYDGKEKVWSLLKQWKYPGLRTRALHNVFVNLELANEIKRAICEKKIKKYVKNVFMHTSLSYLLEDEKIRKELY